LIFGNWNLKNFDAHRNFLYAAARVVEAGSKTNVYMSANHHPRHSTQSQYSKFNWQTKSHHFWWLFADIHLQEPAFPHSLKQYITGCTFMQVSIVENLIYSLYKPY